MDIIKVISDANKESGNENGDNIVHVESGPPETATKTMQRMLELEEEDAAKRRWMKEVVNKGQSEIANFYEGAVVFVTGGSGFVGKQLIEKLIRSCNVAQVYTLMRPKKGKQIKERFEDYINEPVFDNLRKEQPNFADKIAAVEGDMTKLKIGLAENDWRNIAEEVHFIFHAAASTHFELPLKMATLINIRGTREVLTLAKECKQLRSMVYMSTAYTHATRSRIEGDVLEEFYECPVSVDAMIQLAETMSQKTLDEFMNMFRKEWTNTYSFTKAIAEEAVRTMNGHVPVCIVRPAIVIGSANEPAPGWIDTNAIFTISGLILGIGLGINHLFYTDKDKVLDFVPVDYVNNAAIVAAREAVKRHSEGKKEAKIYTMSTIRNLADKFTLIDVQRKDADELLPTSVFWYNFLYITKRKFEFTLLTWFFHYIPALLVDIVLALKGKGTRLFKLYKKIYKVSIAFEHYSKNNFKLSDSNTLKLYQNLSQIDKEIFQFNMESLKLREFYTKWTYGLRKYLIPDGLKNTQYAKKKHSWLKILHYAVVILYIFIIYKILAVVIWSLCSLYQFVF